MNPDIERWQRRYRDAGPREEAPDPVLLAQAHLLGEPGLALDLACGRGANALWLAARGWQVVAVDGSLVALEMAGAAARARGLELALLAADLDRYPLPEARFDLVVTVRYLNRALVPAVKRALRPGGTCFHRTFNRLHQADVPTFNPAYLLEPGELLALYDGLETLATNDGPVLREPSTFWLGRRTR